MHIENLSYEWEPEYLPLGYEDLNDHDDLSKDQFLAAMVGKLDPTRSKPHSAAG